MGCGICKSAKLAEFTAPPVQKATHPPEIYPENLDFIGPGSPQEAVIQTKLPAEGQNDSVESAQRPIDTYGNCLLRALRQCKGGYRGSRRQPS